MGIPVTFDALISFWRYYCHPAKHLKRIWRLGIIVWSGNAAFHLVGFVALCLFEEERRYLNNGRRYLIYCSLVVATCIALAIARFRELIQARFAWMDESAAAAAGVAELLSNRELKLVLADAR